MQYNILMILKELQYSAVDPNDIEQTSSLFSVFIVPGIFWKFGRIFHPTC